MSAAAAIAGIGATEFSKDSGRSELRLAAEAVQAALADAGLAASDVDGMVTFTMDSNAEVAVARELGIPELRFFSQIGYGGGAACATVHQAAMAGLAVPMGAQCIRLQSAMAAWAFTGSAGRSKPRRWAQVWTA